MAKKHKTTSSPKPPKQAKDNENAYLKVLPNELWLDSIIGKDFYDRDLLRLVDFYVLHSPCKASSYSPKTLESIGWKNPWHSSYFRAAFDEVTGFVEGENFLYAGSKNHFLEKWNDLGYNFPADCSNEYAVFANAGEGNPRMDLLHRIRNSLAHGRFTAVRKNGEFYISMEDVTELQGLNGLYVVARICLKKSTLIGLLDFFEIKSDKAKQLESLYNKSTERVL